MILIRIDNAEMTTIYAETLLSPAMRSNLRALQAGQGYS